MSRIRPLYSQAGQDLWVMRDVFGWMENGYFLDIGAAEGIELSNTYALEKYLGWSGICVEGFSESYDQLLKNRKCESVKIYLAGKSGKVQFAERGKFFGGIVSEQSASRHEGEQFVEGNATTLAELIREKMIPETIDYLTIDVEGAEDEIMSTFPFRSHRFLAATIERPGPKLRESLARNGYILVAEQPNLDAFYIHPDMANSYRIRAMEAARFRSLKPLGKIMHLLSSFKKHGVRRLLKQI